MSTPGHTYTNSFPVYAPSELPTAHPAQIYQREFTTRTWSAPQIRPETCLVTMATTPARHEPLKAIKCLSLGFSFGHKEAEQLAGLRHYSPRLSGWDRNMCPRLHSEMSSVASLSLQQCLPASTGNKQSEWLLVLWPVFSFYFSFFFFKCSICYVRLKHSNKRQIFFFFPYTKTCWFCVHL